MDYISGSWIKMKSRYPLLPKLVRICLFAYGVFIALTILILLIPGFRYIFFNGVYDPYIYPFVRYILDTLFTSESILFGYPALLIWLLGWLRSIYYFLKNLRKRTYIKSKALRLLAWTMLPFVFFYWMWGFNYARDPLSRTLQLQVRAVSIAQLKEEMSYTLDQMNFIRSQMQIGDSSPVTSFFEQAKADTILSSTAPDILTEFGLTHHSNAPVKSFWPNGILHRLNTSGFYNPFTGECYMERDLHPIQVPFIKAHEWCHAQGVTDEGDANFLAYWICVSSGDLAYAYSGYMEYWRYLSFEIRKLDPEAFDISRERLPYGIRTDLLEIRNNLLKYPEFLPALRDKVYDSYLKTHGVQEGMASYNRLVNMVVATKRQKRL